MKVAAEFKRLKAEWGDLQESQGSGLSRRELDAYRGRFPAFCEDMFGLTLTPQQREAAERMDGGATQLAIVGGNGLGKDGLTAARAIFEAFVLRSLSLLSGPTDRQVREILMRREVARLLRRARGKLRFDLYTMAVHIPGEDVAGILAFTATDPDKFTGHHAPRIFIGLTESQGVPEELWQAAQKCRVGDGLFLAVGNPNEPSGPLFNATRSTTWETLPWSAFDHPNIIEGREVIPGGPTVGWIEQMRDEYGADSPFYISAVLGQFPETGLDALVERPWLDAAMRPARQHELDRQSPGRTVYLVVDVARYGRDECVMATAQVGILREFRAWRGKSLVDTSRRIQAHWQTLNAMYPSDVTVVVDDAGVGGGVTDNLRAWGVPVIAFNGAESPTGRYRDRVLNKRAEGYWHLREALRTGTSALPADDKLAEELLATTYALSPSGKIQIEDKELIKKRIGRSPDRADVASMAAWAEFAAHRMSVIEWRL